MKTIKVIRLPNQSQVTIAAYVSVWHKVLAETYPDRQFLGWDYFSVSQRKILADIRQGVHDRINRHLPWAQHLDKSHSCSRTARHLQHLVRAGLLVCECRWCGQPLSRYEPHHNRFCEASCQRFYYV